MTYSQTAVIIGGSISGLLHGILLKHHGFNVTILEKDTSPICRGYDAGVKEGLDMLAFLDKCDQVKHPQTISCLTPRTINQEGKASWSAGKAYRDDELGASRQYSASEFRRDDE
ncbi:uncharacterized protein EI97DRAFT_440639 [Westerdykella ornata]|uniref:FAD-binding domain-containing protein n=1 Tax=Westerdykella ornata TaxID=318751 RepID=A0A6A6JNB6_WESOR|nr:uncharacterized protein EI97DRAFT_440639 [Westerdykella ornata]KAF2278120.1 hypothetical protein EI97DRAFT_440639 [Westerdykella ornata]